MSQDDKVIVECFCGCVALEIEKLWDDTPELAMIFRATRFWGNQKGFWYRLKTGVKLFWKVLTRGDYFLHELIVEGKDVNRLKDYLDSATSEMNDSNI